MKDRRRNGLSFVEILVIIALAVVGTLLLHHRFGSLGFSAWHSDGAAAGESRQAEAWDRDSLYQALHGALEAVEEEIVFPYDCSDMLFGVYKEVLADHPELFWLSGGGTFVKKTAGTYVTVEFRPEILIDREEILTRRAAVEERAGEILARCAEGETLWDRLLLLHDILVDETDYDEAAAEAMTEDYTGSDMLSQSTSAYGALVNRRAVCSGYAAAFQLIAGRMGAECRRVQGTELKTGAPHEWNVVLLDGDWVQVDVTWDDPVFAGETPDRYRSYDYFCITTEEILLNHVPDDPAAMPDCASGRWSYYARAGCTLDAYDPDVVARIIAAQAGCDCVFLKFPSEEDAEDALARLLNGQEVFEIPALEERGVKSAGGAASEMGTVCLWFFA